ncbi:hypothetical protein C7M40_03097 (plasmid) [Lactiplantibacillus plantarum]|nr:hypothetical protein C7M40_03097 [Lactiplantibacillus plantarum]
MGVNGEYKVQLCGVLGLYGRYLLAYNLIQLKPARR